MFTCTRSICSHYWIHAHIHLHLHLIENVNFILYCMPGYDKAITLVCGAFPTMYEIDMWNIHELNFLHQIGAWGSNHIFVNCVWKYLHYLPVLLSMEVCPQRPCVPLYVKRWHCNGNACADPESLLNSLAPGKFDWNFRLGIFKQILVIHDWGISCEIVHKWKPQDLTEDKSTLVPVMAWCRQATSHYLSHCWHSSLSWYGVTGPQWVKRGSHSDLHCQFRAKQPTKRNVMSKFLTLPITTSILNFQSNWFHWLTNSVYKQWIMWKKNAWAIWLLLVCGYIVVRQSIIFKSQESGIRCC